MHLKNLQEKLACVDWPKYLGAGYLWVAGLRKILLLFFKFHFAFEMCSSLRIYNRKAAFTLPQTLVAFFFSPLKCTSLWEEGNGRTIFSISISLENQWKLHSAVDGVVNEWMQPHNFSGLYKLEGEKQTPCGQSASYLGEFFKRYSECPGVNLLPLFSRMAVI